MTDEVKAPFADQTSKLDKKLAGRTDASETPVEIRSGHTEVDDALRDWIHQRLGRQLGKYAPQIERVQVRFGDENGSKGGIDKCCLIHVILSKLPPVVVESRGGTEREAFDLAAGRAERATRRDMEKHGVHTHRSQQTVKARDEEPSDQVEEADANPDSMLGRHRPDDMRALVAWELDAPSTEDPGVSADDIKVGADHTAVRNAKQNTEGMIYELEDSTNGRPSRKSTRRSSNHAKQATPLTQRTKAAVHSPKQDAVRAAAHGTPRVR